MPACLTPAELARDLAVRDLTDPAQGPHALQLLVDAAVARLVAAWGVDVVRHRRSPVVAVEENYDRLRITAEAVTRDVRYSRYVDEAGLRGPNAGRRMLRGHTTAMIPAALREVREHGHDDVLLVCPGIVYRRDAIDRLHTGTPHQLDLWRVSRHRDRRLGAGDLDELISLLVDELAPGRRWRAEPRVHPYTLDGRQVDVEWHPGEWVEVWECGLAHPEVLSAAGLHGATGLALGMGLDRLLMLRKDLPDIRLLRSADPRIAGQLLDLAPYKPVSSMPAVRRDVSVAVDAGDAAEDLGDRVREALGPSDADAVEEVSVLAETAYEDVPPAARARLRITSGQKNLLVRIVLRHLTRTLTDEEANVLRDRIYTALHAPP